MIWKDEGYIYIKMNIHKPAAEGNFCEELRKVKKVCHC
jgi:hypothetical protein